ncbi:hypothetical protein XH84_06685 [Bradyrhizobium nanningense]|nr:hypothetical protein XH84_06685 [Bradyrhizobium nanningense]
MAGAVRRSLQHRQALAIAVLAIERLPGPLKSASDQSDMKALLDEMIDNNAELAHYARAARIAVIGVEQQAISARSHPTIGNTRV